MSACTYREAIREAIRQAMLADERVFCMGEDIGHYGGCYAVTLGLLEEFGPERIRDTPLSESAFVGAGIGAALGGQRPIVELMTVNFSLLALDQILNNAATLRYMSGGQLSVPLVIRMATGAGRQVAAQHSHSLEGWYAHIPGLRVLTPATIEDARGMFQPALEDPDPVIIFEHAGLYNEKGDLPDDPKTVAIEGAVARREGQDVTLVAYGGTVRVALGAAEELAAAGVSAEVVDLRCLRPLDSVTVAASVTKTHSVIVLDEGWRTGSVSAEVASRVSEDCFYDLDAPVARSRVHGRGPHSLRQTSGGCGLAPGGRCRGRRAPAGGLMGDFHMPSLGADMEVGRVTEWLVKVGDEVKRGDIVADVETEKSTIEVEIFESGVIEAIVVPVGEEVPVGAVLARVRSGASGSAEASGTVPAATEPTPPTEREATTIMASAVRSPIVRHLAAESGLDLNAITGTGEGGVITRHDVEQAVAAGQSRTGRLRSSPRARAVAAELGVDLNTVQGTGPRGAVTEGDVRKFNVPRGRVAASSNEGAVTAVVPEAPASAGPTSDATAKQTALRRAIGELMARSKREIPRYYLSTTIDMRKASEWLEHLNAGRSITDRIVMPVLLLKATARAVATVPEMNGFMVHGQFEASTAVHVGVAISLRGGGVIAPAIHDRAALRLDELMVALRDLVKRTRLGRLRSSEMSDPTITLTNLGDLGVDQVVGVIYPPQVALVGFGKVTERPWAEGGLLGARSTVTATLAADHRVSDGHRGGLFLSKIDHLLQAPEDL